MNWCIAFYSTVVLYETGILELHAVAVQYIGCTVYGLSAEDGYPAPPFRSPAPLHLPCPDEIREHEVLFGRIS